MSGRAADIGREALRQDPAHLEKALIDLCADCYADPLRFVVEAYDWPINGRAGPDPSWQVGELQYIGEEVQARGFDGVQAVEPIRGAISSGHSAGKSALLAWIENWLMSTRRNAQGSVTANTDDQLQYKTWAAIQVWAARCITAHWFTINATIHFRKGHRASWFCVPLPNNESKSDAFQGQHAPTSTSFYLVDEASGLGPKIAAAIEGGMTDGEPHAYLTGNMVRNTGLFYESVFGRTRVRWHPQVVDTRRTASPPPIIAQWREDYGEDSDFFRVRVCGLAPRASELQYIDKERVDLARVRAQPHLPADPLVAGFDVSGDGSAWNVIRFRRGLNGRVLPPIRMPGGSDPDRSKRVALCAELLSDTRPERQIAAMFIDTAFGAAIAATLKMMGYDNVIEVNFGGESADAHQANARAYMYARAKEWLLYGSIPDEDLLCEQLILPGYHINKAGKLLIESKADLQKRGERSPDDGDAFVLTFAQPIAPRKQRPAPGYGPRAPIGKSSWMGA
jgi:hypothetical protein